MRAITYADLKSFGIPFTRKHIREMVLAGDFPKPFALSRHRIAWTEDQIVGWITARANGTRPPANGRSGWNAPAPPDNEPARLVRRVVPVPARPVAAPPIRHATPIAAPRIARRPLNGGQP